jgi:hypothetical protein
MVVAEQSDTTTFEGPLLTPERAWLVVAYARTLGLLRGHLPRTLTGLPGWMPEEDWTAVAPAFAARMARTAEAMSALVPLRSHLDGMTLARNLLDHTITFAWIAADPDQRLPIWLREDYRERLKIDAKIRNAIKRARPDAGLCSRCRLRTLLTIAPSSSARWPPSPTSGSAPRPPTGTGRRSSPATWRATMRCRCGASTTTCTAPTASSRIRTLPASASTLPSNRKLCRPGGWGRFRDGAELSGV